MPMATTASSSSQPGRTLPLVNCPQCFVPVVKRLSKNGNFYYKCPQRCGKWWFEDAYELYLRSDHANLLANSIDYGHNAPGAVEVVQQPASNVVQGFQHSCGELKMVALDLKLLLKEMKLEIGNLKTEVEELKEMKKGKGPIGVAVVFMAIFVAVLVAFMWKK